MEAAHHQLPMGTAGRQGDGRGSKSRSQTPQCTSFRIILIFKLCIPFTHSKNKVKFKQTKKILEKYSSLTFDTLCHYFLKALIHLTSFLLEGH